MLPRSLQLPVYPMSKVAHINRHSITKLWNCICANWQVAHLNRLHESSSYVVAPQTTYIIPVVLNCASFKKQPRLKFAVTFCVIKFIMNEEG